MGTINIKQIDEIIRQHTDPEPFSGVFRLSKSDQVIFEAGYGLAIRSEGIPNRANTRFQTASGSKIFTSLAVCRLVEQGELALDARLTDFLPDEFPDFDPEITVRQLLTHASGITSYFEEDIDPDYEALWREIPMYAVRGPRDFLPLFQGKGMKFPPGERFEYNDGGYILLGLILEAVTGDSFPDIIQEAVFNPAGMVDSGYFPADQLPERTAYAYIQNPDGSWRTNIFAVPVIGAPDGGAYTTAPDMASFWTALRDGKLLSREMTEALLSPQIETGWKVPYTHYGYGVWIEQVESVCRKFFVEGYDPGVSMRSAYYPSDDLTMTLMGNTVDFLWPLYSKIEQVLLGS